MNMLKAILFTVFLIFYCADTSAKSRVIKVSPNNTDQVAVTNKANRLAKYKPDENASLTVTEATLVAEQSFLDPNKNIAKASAKWTQKTSKKLPLSIESPYQFFDYKPSIALSKRMYIDESTGSIFFHVKKGLLKSNIAALMKETRNTKHLVYKVGTHRVFSDYWVSGHSMYEVINNIITPYKQPSQIMFGVFIGQTIGVFYATDKDFWNVN